MYQNAPPKFFALLLAYSLHTNRLSICQKDPKSLKFKYCFFVCPNLPNHLSHITPPHINYIFIPFQNLCRGFLLRLSSQGRIQNNYEVWWFYGHCTKANGPHPKMPAQYFSPICPILPHSNNRWGNLGQMGLKYWAGILGLDPLALEQWP